MAAEILTTSSILKSKYATGEIFLKLDSKEKYHYRRVKKFISNLEESDFRYRERECKEINSSSLSSPRNSTGFSSFSEIVKTSVCSGDKDFKSGLKFYRVAKTNWGFVTDDKNQKISMILQPFSVNMATDKVLSYISEFYSKTILETEQVYTPIQRFNVMNTINGYLKSKNVKTIFSPDVNLDIGSRSKTDIFTYQDFTAKILENPWSVILNPIGTNYYTYIDEDGIFLVGNYTINFLSSNIVDYPTEYFPICLETDLIAQENRLGDATSFPKYYLVAHDCIGYGGKSIIDKAYDERLMIVYDFINKIDISENSEIRIVGTTILHFRNSDSFFRANNDILDSFIRSHYQIDGLLYKPNLPYSKKHNLEWRKVHTIDLLHNEGKWYSIENRKKRIEIDVKIKKNEGYRNEFIYELIYELGSSGSVAGGGWRVNRERHDRFMPNDIEKVNIILELILNPITEETIRGLTLELYKRYHQREKDHLFSKISGERLFDIGSGRLNDLPRWGKFKKIYAIEDDMDKIAIGLGRIEEDKEEKMEEGKEGGNRISYVLEKLEDFIEKPDEVLINRVDVISFFFSISTYFDKEKIIDFIDLQLKNGGYLLIMTMEKELIDNGFKFLATNEKKIAFPEGPDVRIEMTNDEKIILSLPGTSVVNAINDPPSMKYFVKELKKIDIEVVEQYILDKEHCLNQGEKLLTSFFSAWIFKRGNNIEREEPFKEIFTTPFFAEETGSIVDEEIISEDEIISEGEGETGEESGEEAEDKCLTVKESEMREMMRFKGMNLFKIGTIGDGNCLIHAILYLTSSEYRKLNKNGKIAMAIKKREELAENFTKEIYEEIIPEDLRNEREYRYSVMKKELGTSGKWLEYKHVKYIAEQFKINLFFFSCQKDKYSFYSRGNEPPNPNWSWAMLLWTGEVHFESVIVEKDDGKFLFKISPENSFSKILETYKNK